jgi:hypothetical protein
MAAAATAHLLGSFLRALEQLLLVHALTQERLHICRA